MMIEPLGLFESGLRKLWDGVVRRELGLSLKIYLVTCAVAVHVYNDGRFGCLVNCLYMLTHGTVYGHSDILK